MAPHLKLFDSEDFDTGYAPEPAVRVRLGDLLPLVSLAHRRNLAWLKDFLDDEVAITDDLYEVLQSFSEYKTGA